MKTLKAKELISGALVNVQKYGNGKVTGWVGYPKPDAIRVHFDSDEIRDFHPSKLDALGFTIGHQS